MKWCPSYFCLLAILVVLFTIDNIVLFENMPKIYMMKLLVVKEIDILIFKYSL